MNRNKIFTYLAITLTSISFYFAMQNFDMISDYIGKVLGILKPFLVGIAIAYLLWRPLKFIESLLEKFIFRGKISKGNRRIVGVVVLYLIAAVVIASLFSFVLPQIIESLTILTNNLPGYFESIKQTLDTLLRNSGMDGDIYQFVSDLIGNLSHAY